MEERFLVDKLISERALSSEEYKTLLVSPELQTITYLHEAAQATSVRRFGNGIFIRGLLEFTNICRNDCLYCGIRRSNRRIARYCLSIEDILNCCRQGYLLGFRTFVLQGGELPDPCDMLIENICSAIHGEFPDCAITLSLGERKEESYRRFFNAGATRYLLRHETRNEEHYSRLHPATMSLGRRLQCLDTLKSIGYQTGTGFMVGSPFQTIDNIVEDIIYIQEFKPEMIGIGPYIPHKDTPLGKGVSTEFYTSASQPSSKSRQRKNKTLRDNQDKISSGGIHPVEMTLRLISIFRLMFPDVLIPATTALASVPVPANIFNHFKLAPKYSGRELGILSGANVVMPNLSPENVRGTYSIYDNKASAGAESAEGLQLLSSAFKQIGYKIKVDRGDYCQTELF